MWSAIKNDLFEFVATVQSDTKETLSKVIISPKDIHLSSSETSDHTAKKKKSYEVREEAAGVGEGIEWRTHLLSRSHSLGFLFWFRKGMKRWLKNWHNLIPPMLRWVSWVWGEVSSFHSLLTHISWGHWSEISNSIWEIQIIFFVECSQLWHRENLRMGNRSLQILLWPCSWHLISGIVLGEVLCYCLSSSLSDDHFCPPDIISNLIFWNLNLC